jgi:hypothetical protein
MSELKHMLMLWMFLSGSGFSNCPDTDPDINGQSYARKCFAEICFIKLRIIVNYRFGIRFFEIQGTTDISDLFMAFTKFKSCDRVIPLLRQGSRAKKSASGRIRIRPDVDPAR